MKALPRKNGTKHMFNKHSLKILQLDADINHLTYSITLQFGERTHT